MKMVFVTCGRNKFIVYYYSMVITRENVPLDIKHAFDKLKNYAIDVLFQ